MAGLLAALLVVVFRLFQRIGEVVSDLSYEFLHYRLARCDLGYSVVGGAAVGFAWLPMVTLLTTARYEGWAGLSRVVTDLITGVTLLGVAEFVTIEAVAGGLGVIVAFGSGAMAWALNGFRDDFPDD